MNKTSLLLAGLALAGCHRSANVKSGSVATGTATPVAKAETTPAGIKTVSTNFTYFAGRGKLHFQQGGDDKTVNFALRVRRDSAIWLSGSLLGIEGVRALLTLDSVRVVNRLEKTYYAGSYATLGQLLSVPVSYQQVQAIVLGDYQPAPKGAVPVVKAEGDNQSVTYPQSRLVLEQLVSLASGRLQQLKVSEGAAQRSLTVSYSEFQKPTGWEQPFAFASTVVAQQAGQSTTATLNYQKVEVGSGHLDFPFSVPASYKRETRLGKK